MSWASRDIVSFAQFKVDIFKDVLVACSEFIDFPSDLILHPLLVVPYSLTIVLVESRVCDTELGLLVEVLTQLDEFGSMFISFVLCLFGHP